MSSYARSSPPDDSEGVFAELRPRIIVDGVFFQRQSSGIARVWTALLEEWAKSGFIRHIVFLDRSGSGAQEWLASAPNRPPQVGNRRLTVTR
jgi:hypothetical protein